ncbi:electron transfer flavoprotein subunit beta/FixA family protein [Legionella parisiensis]|uniref:Electron transfer flavoprotein subunit beta n=1 Tax=Legionella parisiensis TaxID=45071 RepID=A0A1E5JPC2_9GAMM|nr:electron transfer flavoprotein subunit beta/FixA family protein [Legionella parisiensis]KTD42031.1 electron transfer flavoprotein beta-subunit (Beta-ETF) [Legionella parisiensis]OEH46397.1 Electron transfer flavoprotein subunit beta [Legionella parisiensis]STX75485.1 electron transfer flavoprotein beta-subunit (Beta-ETF) [Legionella parisiensis]
MKVLVAVKRVIDPYVKIRVKSDHTGVETHNIKMAMNPFDEIAIEEALRLREKNWATEVVAVSIGGESSQETLRHALALGADRAILIRTQDSLESLNVAKILKKIIDDENPNLVLMGKQAIDGDNNQTPQMLASLLNWPQATYASKIEASADHLQVTREIDGGLETIKVLLPAVVSTDLRLNEPRYASLPNIMKAKKKPLVDLELDKLGLSLKKHVEVLKVTEPDARSAGVKVESVSALLDKLQHEAKVL